MFSPRVFVAIVAFAFTALATNSTCWYFLPNAQSLLAFKLQRFEQIANLQLRVGNIGEPCYDHGNGCSLTGAMVSFSYSLHSFGATAVADQQAQIVILACKRTDPRRHGSSLF